MQTNSYRVTFCTENTGRDGATKAETIVRLGMESPGSNTVKGRGVWQGAPEDSLAISVVLPGVSEDLSDAELRARILRRAEQTAQLLGKTLEQEAVLFTVETIFSRFVEVA